MRKIILSFCQLAALVILHNSTAAAEPDYPATPANVNYGKLLGLPFKQEDALYYYGEDSNQLARLWLPTQTNNAQKLVVLIHGGCWLNEFDMSHTFPLATALSQAGYAVWSLEYRRTGDQGGGWPGSFDDIKAGISFLSRLEAHNLSSAPLAIVGHSAGGHLALLAGNEFPQAQAVIGLAAISDIQAYSQGGNDCETATTRFMGGSFAEIPEQYDSANPATLGVHKNTTLLHGTADSIVNISQSKISGAVTKIEPGAGHFDWVHPGTKAAQLLLDTLEESF